jgi:hypothetical protein
MKNSNFNGILGFYVALLLEEIESLPPRYWIHSTWSDEGQKGRRE